METTIVYWGYTEVYFGIMEKKVETTIVYSGYIEVYFGIMEREWKLPQYIGVIQTSILGSWKRNGNYYSIFGLYRSLVWDHGKKMETTIVYWGYIEVYFGIMEREWKLL